MIRSAPNPRRVAFFGGSFDPPHQGHLAVALAAQRALSLDSVLFVPVGSQPLKPEGSSAGFPDRLAMTRLAIASYLGFAVSLLDAPRPSPGPNYTVDSLARLRAEQPAGTLLYCILGADSFLSLHRWHRAAEIPFLASLILASRPGLPLDDLEAGLPTGLTLELDPPGGTAIANSSASPVDIRLYAVGNQSGDTAPLYLLPGLHVDISASEIRSAIQSADNSLSGPDPLLPSAVLGYIRAHGLYR